MDSDSEERELERLVFGNDGGFRTGVKDFAKRARTTTATLDFDDEEESTGFEGVDDALVSIHALVILHIFILP